MSAEPTLEPTHEAAATTPQTLWRQREFMLLWGGLVILCLSLRSTRAAATADGGVLVQATGQGGAV